MKASRRLKFVANVKIKHPVVGVTTHAGYPSLDSKGKNVAARFAMRMLGGGTHRGG
jgi:hypothetical protein